VLPGDVEIYLVLEADDLWSREGSTLFYKHTLTLTEALCGKIVEVPTFDNRVLSVAITQVMSPGDTQTVPGEGILGGELILCYDLKFPKTLTPEQKKAIKAVGMK